MYMEVIYISCEGILVLTPVPYVETVCLLQVQAPLVDYSNSPPDYCSV